MSLQVLCGQEGQACNFKGTKTVSFGVPGKKLISKSATNTIPCTTTAFGGKDPVPGSTKYCYIPASPGDSNYPGGSSAPYTLCALEGGDCSVKAPATLIFGVPQKWRQYSVKPGTQHCGTAALGGDPAFGYRKACYLPVATITGPAPIVPPMAPKVTTTTKPVVIISPSTSTPSSSTPSSSYSSSTPSSSPSSSYSSSTPSSSPSSSYSAPVDTSSGGTAPVDTSTPSSSYSAPVDTSTPSSSYSAPVDTSTPSSSYSAPVDTSSGGTAPVDTSGGSAAPVDTSGGSAAPVDTSGGSAAPVDTSGGSAAPVDTSGGSVAPSTSASGVNWWIVMFIILIMAALVLGYRVWKKHFAASPTTETL
jgi:hypothetical protein